MPTAGSRPGARLRLARRTTMALPFPSPPITVPAVGRLPFRLPHLSRFGLRGAGIAATVTFLIFLIDALVNPRAFFDLWLMHQIQQIEAQGLTEGIRIVNDLTSSTGAVAMWGLAVLGLALAV